MKTLFIDIETFGNKPEEKEIVLPTEADVKVGNIKDPAKIKAKVDEVLPQMIAEAKAKHKEEFDKEWRGNALKSLNLDVIALSYAIDDGDIVSLYGEEKDIMAKFEAELISLGHELHSTRLVAHNGYEFDFPILRHRAMKYGHKKMLHFIPSSNRSDKHVDTMVLFRGSSYKSYYSMDNICKFFGIDGKGDIDGSMVHDMYLNGDIKKIAEYCSHDVDRLRAMYNIMKL